MKTIDVLMVRIYITEGSHLLNKIVDYLRNDVKIRGISVFRAISGFGDTGNHTATLVDLSLNLPLTVEFFDDDKSKIEKALDHLNTIVKPEHIVMWEAKANSNRVL
jgi:PII-like signaling protein